MSKILLVLLTSIFVTGCSLDLKSDKPIENGMIQENVQLNDIPEFSNEPYTVLNGNVPLFTDEEITSTETFEEYSDTDRLAQAQTETAISYMEQQIFDGLRVYYSKVDPTKTEEDWKDFYYETADAMFTGTNQFLHMRLFYFVYIPNESRVMIIYSAPFDFFDDTIMEHEFERE